MDNSAFASDNNGGLEGIFTEPPFIYVPADESQSQQISRQQHLSHFADPRKRYHSFMHDKHFSHLLPESAAALADFGIYVTGANGLTRCYSCYKEHSNLKNSDKFNDPALHETYCVHFESYQSGFNQSTAQGAEPFWHENSATQCSMPRMHVSSQTDLHHVQGYSVFHSFRESFGEFVRDATARLSRCFPVEHDRRPLSPPGNSRTLPKETQ